MQNIAMKQVGNILTITIDTSERHGVSGSGKSEVIASTGGNIEVPGAPGVKIGINCYTPVKK